MPDRTVKVVYYTTLEGDIHYRGDTIDLSEEEAERGEALGAFQDSEDDSPSSLESAFGEDDGRTALDPVPPEGNALEVDEDDVADPEPVEETDEFKAHQEAAEADDGAEDASAPLKGKALEEAGADAGYPSLGDRPWNELRAAEKRQVLGEPSEGATPEEPQE